MGFKERMPFWVPLVLAIVEVVLTIVIIGTEFGSFYQDIGHGTIWAGFWSALVYVPTFIMLFFITCCCRGRICASYILVLHVLSICVSGAVIYFSIYFQDNLCQCYLGTNICCLTRDIRSFNANYTAIVQQCSPVNINGYQQVIDPCSSSPPTGKLPYLKAELAAGCAMAVTCIVYIAAYIFAMLGICFGH